MKSVLWQCKRGNSQVSSQVRLITAECRHTRLCCGQMSTHWGPNVSRLSPYMATGFLEVLRVWTIWAENQLKLAALRPALDQCQQLKSNQCTWWLMSFIFSLATWTQKWCLFFFFIVLKNSHHYWPYVQTIAASRAACKTRLLWLVLLRKRNVTHFLPLHWTVVMCRVSHGLFRQVSALQLSSCCLLFN